MAKMISISDDLYKKLDDLKRGDESFGSVIAYLAYFYLKNKDGNVELAEPKHDWLSQALNEGNGTYNP